MDSDFVIYLRLFFSMLPYFSAKMFIRLFCECGGGGGWGVGAVTVYSKLVYDLCTLINHE